MKKVDFQAWRAKITERLPSAELVWLASPYRTFNVESMASDRKIIVQKNGFNNDDPASS